jgi:hypothetical protein
MVGWTIKELIDRAVRDVDICDSTWLIFVSAAFSDLSSIHLLACDQSQNVYAADYGLAWSRFLYS